MSQSQYPANQIILGPTGLKIGSVDADPRSVAQEGHPGDVLFSSTTKKLYVKQDGGTSTNWNLTDLASLSGDVTSTAAGVATIAALSVTEAKMAAQALSGKYAKRIAVATYSFASQGGAIGDINLSVAIPSGAIIQRTFLDVITAPTSADVATVAIKAQSAGDILAVTAIADLTPGLHEGIQDGLASHMVKCTAARTLTLSVADFALTAGKFYLFVEYVQSSAT